MKLYFYIPNVNTIHYKWIYLAFEILKNIIYQSIKLHKSFTKIYLFTIKFIL